jgi:hypothetical protein
MNVLLFNYNIFIKVATSNSLSVLLHHAHKILDKPILNQVNLSDAVISFTCRSEGWMFAPSTKKK